MLYLNEQIKLSEYNNLYDILIPKNHMLRKMIELINFNFVFDALKDKYCLDNGRGAEDPIRMFKYLL